MSTRALTLRPGSLTRTGGDLRIDRANFIGGRVRKCKAGEGGRLGGEGACENDEDDNEGRERRRETVKAQRPGNRDLRKTSRATANEDEDVEEDDEGEGEDGGRGRERS